MRVRLHFQIPSNFTINYRLVILSYLKESIRSQSSTFYHTFFIENKGKTKPYSFATFFRNIKIKNDAIHADSMSVTVTSSNTEFIIYLINGSQQITDFSYKDISMTLTRVELIKEKTITQPQVWFKTLSPILIESKEGRPVLFDHPDFEQELNFVVSNMMQEIEGRPLFRPLKVLKSNFKKVVIKENFHQQMDRDLYFTANQGEFLLEGDSRDLHICFQVGVGLRNGVGFGCIQIL